MARKFKMGMIGGGIGAFIGNVHRIAAVMDNEIELVCGAFCSDAARSKESGKAWHIDDARSYNNYEQMILKEKSLPEGERMDFVCIVTPNHLHFDVAKMALENGFHVVCDKPVTFNHEEALVLEKLVKKTGLLFCVTHAYHGYPMIREARERIRSGELGKIRKVMVDYPQGWLTERIEQQGQKQASWRTDPKRSGISCTMGDIGVHAFLLAEYVSELKVTDICADLSTFVEGRMLDDDGSVLLRFEKGAKGVLCASQVLTGEENSISLRIFGEKGSLEWKQSDNNSLYLKWLDRPCEIIRTANPSTSKEAQLHSRVPAGHPEGYLEAFANLYRNFADALHNKQNGQPANPLLDYPSIADGVRGMLFIEKVVESGKSEVKWIKI